MYSLCNRHYLALFRLVSYAGARLASHAAIFPQTRAEIVALRAKRTSAQEASAMMSWKKNPVLDNLRTI